MPGVTTTVPSTDGRRTNPWETVKRGLALSPELRVGLGWTVVLALIATLGRAVVPIAVQRTIDVGLGGGGGPIDLGATVRIVALAGLAVLLTAGTSGAMNVRLARTVETALSSLRVGTFRHIQDLSMLHQAAEQRGALVSRVTSDIDEISRFMQWGGVNLITSAGQLLVAVAVMAVYSWRMTLVVLATFVPFVAATRWFQVRLTVAYRTVRQRVGELLGILAEVVVGAPVVRAYGIESRTQGRLDAAISNHYQASVTAGRLSSSLSGLGELYAASATAAVLVAGVLWVAAGQLTPGTVTAFFFLVTLFVQPVRIASETINEAQTAVAGWRRVLDVLDIEPDVADPGEDGRAIPPGPIAIRFDHVSFAYPMVPAERDDPSSYARAPLGPTVLHDVDVDIAPQTRVAVVGETGSGKTTFAKLLTRLMDPVQGAVRLNGIDLREVTFQSLRDRVVMVPQDGMLFDGTIAENVRHGDPGLSDERLEVAFIELGLMEWIESLPDRFGTEVGERGTELSSGERQLVAVARAYVADPDLLVLDEATSAVDPATEVRLQRALAGLTRGRATVTIAHRLSTAEAADEVLVFDDGVLVQRGTHGQLVDDASGPYATMHAAWRSGSASLR
ncbi:MAG TPA: ABC transporter ATP-binding protein [Nitriliruptorales bacterium]